ncbi:MAG: putative ATP-binding cassette transporter [Phenylobacterium sp.]|jgi:putative ATP-binding cassette transporter
MDLLRFFLSSANLPQRKLIYYSTLAGGTNVLLIALLNSAAANAEDQAAEMFILLLFGINVVIFLIAQKFIWRTSTTEVENVVNNIRLKLINKISGCDLEALEKMGRSDIFAAINQHANVIAMSALPVVISIQSLILLAFTLIYIAYLSMPAFFLIAVFLSCAIFFALQRSAVAEKLFEKAVGKETSAYTAITDLLEGFKEVKLNKDREIGLIDHTAKLSASARDSRIEANQKMALNYISTQTSFYLTIAGMIFLLPLISNDADNFASAVIKIITACIFLVSPINTIIAVLPSFTSAVASFHFINNIDDQLSSGQEQGLTPVHQMDTFESLKLTDVVFYFTNDKGERRFQMGPVSLEIFANEIVFFTGGNGSGKTTLIKALVGLYGIKSGKIEYNGREIRDAELPSYRNLFTAIFTDFHLFKRFYGLDIDPNEAQDLLQLFQLHHKTAYADGEFLTQDLSTGQRKRLALIVSILEKRPIMILDEWAADQDPTFRAIFYQQLLPRLQAEGRTILAISHDEQYFDCADERFHIIEGKLADKSEYNRDS